MGNYLYLIGPSKSYTAYVFTYNKSNFSLENQYVTSIEERCTDLDSIFKFPIGRHSYLILETTTGEQIRIDYHDSSLEPDVTHNYEEIGLSDPFRYSKISKKLSIADALRIVRKHCVKQPYDFFSHNCQHVSRDVFCEMTGENTNLIRDDFLEWFKRSMPKEMRKNVEYEDEIVKNAKKVGKEMAMDSDASLKEIMRRYEIISGDEVIKENWEELKGLDLTENMRENGSSEKEIQDFIRKWGKSARFYQD